MGVVQKRGIFWNLLTYQLILLVTPGVGDMVLTLSNLSQFFTFFPLLVVKWWVWYTLSECGRSLLIGCCSLLLHQKRSPWRVSRLLLFCYMNSCCRPLYCVPRRWICCRDGEVLSPGLLWKTAQAWLRDIPSFLLQSLQIWLTFSWFLPARYCYLPNIGWVLAEK